jgi:hypothetical protein
MLLETLTIRNCDQLKNIIDFGDYGSNNWCNVFPKLKELYIEGCPKMEYIFGHYTDDHQNQVVFQLQLLEFKRLHLCNLPSLVAMCPKHYRIKFPLLEKRDLNKCSEAAKKSMSHFKIQPALNNATKVSLFSILLEECNSRFFIFLKRPKNQILKSVTSTESSETSLLSCTSLFLRLSQYVTSHLI